MKGILSEGTRGDCIVCTEETNQCLSCCKAHCCMNCIVRWLNQTRQCMHCRKDLLEFDDWVANYKKDSIQQEVYSLREEINDINAQFNMLIAGHDSIQFEFQV